MKWLYSVLSCCLLGPLPALAQAPAPQPAPMVSVPRLERPPRLDDFAPGQPSAAPRAYARVDDFIQQQPSDGKPATQKTTVYLAYDAEHLYVVWVCADRQANRIRAHWSPRDRVDPTVTYNDDFVELTIDTFHDGRHAFVFTSNPLGIQTDALWTEDAQTRDVTWDEQWGSQGRITNHGFVVIMAIPFKSLRFPAEAAQTWGITLERYIAREDESDYWPRVSSRKFGLLSQAGAITGLEGISPARNLQLTPYLYGRSFHVINDIDPRAPYYQDVRFQGRAGIDLKWVLGNDLVLDGTLNPDFSQLESDQPQFTINRRFQVYFPEKRPFFLENINFFDSAATGLKLSQLLFTRNIADPAAGVKFSGKRGLWDIGFLTARDRSPGESVSPQDPDYQRSASIAVARIARDVGRQSNVGLFLSERELAGGFNRVGALDTSLRLNNNWTAYVRGALSDTRCDSASALCLTGQTAYSSLLPFGEHSGSNIEASLNGEGRRFRVIAQYQDITPQFHTDLGYVPRTDMRSAYLYYHFYWRPEGRYIINWGAETNLQEIWDHTGLQTSYLLNAAPFIGLRGNTRVWFPILSSQSDTLRPQDFAALAHRKTFTQNGVGIDFRTAPVTWFSFNIQAYLQGTIDLVVPDGAAPEPAHETSVNSTLSLKPTGHLQLETLYLLDRVVDPVTQRTVFIDRILRPEITYQYNQQLGFRFIPQYDSLLANDHLTSLVTTRNLNFDFLITYLVHPGTAIYAGYNSNLENIAPSLCRRLAVSSSCDPNAGLWHLPGGRLRNDARQVFLKMSYQMRL